MKLSVATKLMRSPRPVALQLGWKPKREPQTGFRLKSVTSTLSPNTRLITSCAGAAQGSGRAGQQRRPQRMTLAGARAHAHRRRARARTSDSACCAWTAGARACAPAGARSARRHLDVGDDGEMEVEVEEPASDGNVVSGASGCAPACAHQRTDRTLLGSLGAGAFFPKGMLRSSGAPRPAVSAGRCRVPRLTRVGTRTLPEKV